LLIEDCSYSQDCALGEPRPVLGVLWRVRLEDVGIVPIVTLSLGIHLFIDMSFYIPAAKQGLDSILGFHKGF